MCSAVLRLAFKVAVNQRCRGFISPGRAKIKRAAATGPTIFLQRVHFVIESTDTRYVRIKIIVRGCLTAAGPITTQIMIASRYTPTWKTLIARHESICRRRCATGGTCRVHKRLSTLFLPSIPFFRTTNSRLSPISLFHSVNLLKKYRITSRDFLTFVNCYRYESKIVACMSSENSFSFLRSMDSLQQTNYFVKRILLRTDFVTLMETLTLSIRI